MTPFSLGHSDQKTWVTQSIWKILPEDSRFEPEAQAVQPILSVEVNRVVEKEERVVGRSRQIYAVCLLLKE
jgi:hypothetical protein